MIKTTTAQALFLVMAPFALSLAACSYDYSPQRSPGQMNAAQPAVHGRKIVPGEANNYEDWLSGEPNLKGDMPWRNSQLKGPSITEAVPTTPVPMSLTTTVVPATAPASTTMSTSVGNIQFQEQYPPYSRR